MQQRQNVFLFQRLQLKDHGSGKQRAVYLKVWVLRGGPDEDQRAVLHEGEQVILLTFIEAMDLVHEHDGPLAVHAQVFFRLRHHGLHVLLPRHRGVDLGKGRAGGVRDHLGQCGLPGPGRPVKDDGAQLVRLNGTIKKPPLPDDVLLPHYLVQCPGPQPRSQG